MQKNTIKGYVYIILSAMLFGCMPLMANHIYADGVNAMTLVLLRNAVSLPMLASLGIFRRESFSVRPRAVLSTMVIGVFGCALTPFLLFSSYNHMSGGTATVLHFVYPAFVLLLGVVIFREKLRGISLLALLLCVIGIAFFYPQGEALSLTGSALALSSGLAYAVYIVLLGHLGSGGMGGYSFSFFATLGATVALLFVCIFSGGFSMPRSALGWILCILFALVINVGAVVLFQNGAFLIGGQKASILSTFEPITSLIVGYIAFREKITLLSVIGSILIISASVLIAFMDGKEADSNEK